MLDAGSSHTSLYIYKWDAEKKNNTGVVYQVEECKVKGEMKPVERGTVGSETMRSAWQEQEKTKEALIVEIKRRHSGDAVVILSL